MSWPLVSLLVGAILFAGLGCGTAEYRVRPQEVLYRTSFETNPSEAGWIAFDKNEPVRANLWMPGLRGAIGRSLRIFNGYCESPPFSVEPFAYYAVSFRSLVDNKMFWAVQFFDADGQRLADHYSSVDASSDWAAHTFTFRGRPEAVEARLRFHGGPMPNYIDDVRVEAIERVEAARWADSVYQSLPPLNWQPEAGRWRHLSQMQKRLRAAGTLRVVMLGDSIINDIGNSAWETLVERRTPGLRIEVVNSVRGSTGCWYYQDEGRIGPYVLDYNPDMVIIGGISQRDDIDAIRSCIRQIRQARPGMEILLTTGMFGRVDPRWTSNWPPHVTADDDNYRGRLKKLANDERCAYLDMEGIWGRYLLETGLPYHTFCRDYIHANARGRQIAARALERFFGME